MALISKAMRLPLYLSLAVFLIVNNMRAADPELTRREWKVDDVTREALVHVPTNATTKATPVVFAFHGHGGNMQNADRMFHCEKFWPEAIVVYMQGLNTPGRLTDPQGKVPGWQFRIGDHGDRDLKFFDTVLASLKKDYKVDSKRIYATGHSNGGSFTYLLWAARGDTFAAVAPSAAIGPWLVAQLKPKPMLHLAGENDPLVKFEWQKEMIATDRKINHCGEGKPWEKNNRCTIYPSKEGTPVVTYIHQKQHGFPADAPEIVVTFFRDR